MGQRLTEDNAIPASTEQKLVVPSIFLSNLTLVFPQVISSLLLIEISETFSTSVGIAGQIRTAASALTIVMSFLRGFLSVRWSHKSLLLLGLMCLVLSAFGSYLAPSLVILLIVYAVTGISNATVTPMSHALIGRLFSLDQRPKIAGYLLAGMATAYVIGSPVIGSIGDWRLAFVITVLPLALGCLILVFAGIVTAPPTQRIRQPITQGFRTVFQNRSAIACIIANVFAIIGGVVAITFVISYFRQEFLLDRVTISLANSGWAILYVFGTLVGGRLVNRYGRKRVTVINAIINGTATFLLFNMPSFPLALLCLATISLSGSFRLTAFNSLALEQVPEYRGTMMSLSQLSQEVATIIATALGGIMLLHFNYSMLGFFGFLVICGALIFHLYTIDPTQHSPNITGSVDAMVKVNGHDVKWEDPPPDWYLTDIKFHVLWKNEATGATFMLVKYPPSSDRWELPHTHASNHFGFALSGEWEQPNGSRITWSAGNYGFGVRPKEQVHGPPQNMKVNQETIILQYFDGPTTKHIVEEQV